MGYQVRTPAPACSRVSIGPTSASTYIDILTEVSVIRKNKHDLQQSFLNSDDSPFHVHLSVCQRILNNIHKTIF